MFFQPKKEEIKNWSLKEALFDSLSAVIEEALVVYDKDFQVLIFNKGAEDLFSIRAEDIVGQNFSLEKAQKSGWKLFASIMYSSLAPQVVRLSEAGEFPQKIKIILDDPAGEFLTITHQIMDNRGQVWGFMKFIKDLTREATLMKSKSEFITIAAHQLRTPATATNWALESLLKEKGLGEEGREIASMGYKAAQNLLKIINDLLNAAQLEEGRFGYQFENLNLVVFLDQLLSEALPIAREYKIKVYFDRPKEAEVMVSADPAKLGLAISNLVDNAIKYNVENGEVVVGLKKKDGQAEISVKDTGVGISREDIPKLFTKFFRGQNVKRLVTEGTGLGLFLVKNIISRHSGQINVDSVIGRGTTFYIDLPLK